MAGRLLVNKGNPKALCGSGQKEIDVSSMGDCSQVEARGAPRPSAAPNKSIGCSVVKQGNFHKIIGDKLRRMESAPVLTSIPRLLLGGGIVLIVMETEAYAFYVDPGSGALILQALFAGFFGSVFYFRKFLARMFFWEKNKKNKQ